MSPVLKKKKKDLTMASDLVSVGIQCPQEPTPGRRKYLPSGDGCKGLIDGGRVQRAFCASVITELAVLFFVFLLGLFLFLLVLWLQSCICFE